MVYRTHLGECKKKTWGEKLGICTPGHVVCSKTQNSDSDPLASFVDAGDYFLSKIPSSIQFFYNSSHVTYSSITCLLFLEKLMVKPSLNYPVAGATYWAGAMEYNAHLLNFQRLVAPQENCSTNQWHLETVINYIYDGGDSAVDSVSFKIDNYKT